jgi:GNAT superfamily N-acetyltransferase
MFEAMGFHDQEQLRAMDAASAPFFERGLRDGTYRGFLAVTSSGEVVAGGGVMRLAFQPHPLDPRPQRAFVVNMYTEPPWRGRGLARRLMEAMIEWCREQGFRVLYLHASDEGRPLYEGLGFKPTNEMRLRLG